MTGEDAFASPDDGVEDVVEHLFERVVDGDVQLF
jgi:hypothetical protein